MSSADNNNTVTQSNDSRHDPLRFVDTLDNGKHIVLFYEDPEYGKRIQFHFINNGLLKGEHGIITTVQNDSNLIENEMIDTGIDVEGFKKKGLLHIYQISNPANHPQGLEKGLEVTKEQILANSKPPYRIVGRCSELSTKEQIESDTGIQRTVHSNFHDFPGSVMCSYPVDMIQPEKHGQWLIDMLHCHHAAIFSTFSGHGIGFHI
jgi:MEDS: MEthanogen/methylotroph, DcmR Sensory domain